MPRDLLRMAAVNAEETVAVGDLIALFGTLAVDDAVHGRVEHVLRERELRSGLQESPEVHENQLVDRFLEYRLLPGEREGRAARAEGEVVARLPGDLS